jgi:uncharacterized membrane protein YhaH (DUF805 family)
MAGEVLRMSDITRGNSSAAGSIFFPYGRTSRLSYLSVLLIWGFGSIFATMLVDEFKDRSSPADNYLMVAAIMVPLAWLQSCATIRRLNDLGWPWLVSLPWIPLCFWPLRQVFQTSIFLDSALIALGGFGMVTGLLLSVRRSAIPGPVAQPRSTGTVEFSAMQAVAPPVGIQPTGNFNPLVGWLVVIEGSQVGKEYRIRAQGNRFGRDSEMEFAIDDAGVLRTHASIVFEPANIQYTIVPLAGAVEVNGQVASKSTILVAWDRLRVGATTLIFIPLCGPWHRCGPVEQRTGAVHV